MSPHVHTDPSNPSMTVSGHGTSRMQSALNEVIRVGANVTGFVSLEDGSLQSLQTHEGLCEHREWRPPVTRKRTSSTQDDITCGHHHLDPGLSACRLCGSNVCGSGCPVCDVVQGSLNQDKDRHHDQGLCSPLSHPKSQVQGRLAQFSSVAQSCPTLCDLMHRGMPGLPVHHQLPESTLTHGH